MATSVLAAVGLMAVGFLASIVSRMGSMARRLESLERQQSELVARVAALSGSPRSRSGGDADGS